MSPHRCEQLLLREHSIGLRRQDEQKRELLAGKAHLAPLDGRPTPCRVDHERPEGDDLLLGGSDRLSGHDAAVEVARAGQPPVHLLVAANSQLPIAPLAQPRFDLTGGGLHRDPSEAAGHDLPKRAGVVE